MISFLSLFLAFRVRKNRKADEHIGLSRLAETFSLKVTVLTPVTSACGGILSTSRSASIQQNDCLLSEVIFIFRRILSRKTQKTIPKNGLL